MYIEVAKAAGALAERRETLAALLAEIDAAIDAGAQIFKIEGNSADGSHRVDLMPFGYLSPELNSLVWQTARDTYATALAEIDAQLAAL